MQLTLLDPAAGNWNLQIECVIKRLPVTGQPFHFPLYFLQSTLPRIGGKVALYGENGNDFAVGFLFPRGLARDGQQVYTLRFHTFSDAHAVDQQAILSLTNQQLAPEHVVFYQPDAPHDYTQTATQIGRVEIGKPSAQEAAQIPQLQQQIWGASPEECYPADLHSLQFAPGSSLVARVEGELAGFLIGFYKFGGYPLPADWNERFNGALRLESQIMGVLPSFRGLRISNLLKRQQALDALEQGIGIINWTADPLQSVNASLNFALLHAVAFDFLPNLYAFRNELNRVPASRLSLSWMIKTAHVQDTLTLDARSDLINLARHPEIQRANDGWQSKNLQIESEFIAIEIPAQWNAIQRNNLEEALQWRKTTDELFMHYIGKAEGKYVIIGVGVDNERHFLVGERSSRALWKRLGATGEGV